MDQLRSRVNQVQSYVDKFLKGKNIMVGKNKTKSGNGVGGVKIKTTILIDKTLKKLAQVYAIQNEMTLGELVEEALESRVVGK